MKQLFLILTIFLFISATAKNIPVYLNDSIPIEERIEDALSRMTTNEKVSILHAQSKFSTPGVPRLGIPGLEMSDGPHGIRADFLWDKWEYTGATNDSCTAFPALTALAATFNPHLSLEYGRAIGEEARYRKKDVLLGPGVNIYRTPLNGRNFEYMGEDPYLASVMCVPYIQGVQENGVAACLKHFAVNNQEKWRLHIDVEVSDRALYEIYLPAFKSAVYDGNVWSIMGAYNKYRGEHCSHNNQLINKVLKGEWNYDGTLVSDWGGTHDTNDAIHHGLDIEMGTWPAALHPDSIFPYENYYLGNPFKEKLSNKEVDEKLLDDKVRRVLRMIYRTSMSKNRPFGRFVCEEHYDVVRRVAEQSIVLLKNENKLFPIAKGKYKKIAVIGENATRSLTVAGGSSELKVQREISPLQGLINEFGETQFEYTMGYGSASALFNPIAFDLVRESPYNADSLRREAVNLAKNSDMVIFIGGLNKNKNQDCEGDDRLSYNLPFEQDKLIEEILKVNKKLAVVIISGNAVAMPWVDKVPVILQSWYLGSESGTALANIISGSENPSGKLPFSIPRKIEDNGAIHFGELSYPGDSIKQVYIEDILVGYRWHDTKNIPALYPFGYGLSYTIFEISDLESDKKRYRKNEIINLSVKVKNRGKVSGYETVQVYVGQNKPTLLRPAKELKAFEKVFLEAGGSKVVRFSIKASDLAYYDDVNRTWVVENDIFTIYIGSSSKKITNKQSIEIQN